VIWWLAVWVAVGLGTGAGAAVTVAFLATRRPQATDPPALRRISHDLWLHQHRAQTRIHANRLRRQMYQQLKEVDQ
jgi:hypothetical protein